MDKEKKIVEAETASNDGMLEVEHFLHERYQFRLNVLNRKVEYVTKASEDEVVGDADARWQPLTDRDLNSIILDAKREYVCEGNPKADIELVLNSKEVRAYDPIREYLEHLPQWDGQNHVAQLFSRLPGLSSEQMGYLATWLRSTVAHWLQLDTLHGNECVPTLIGAQGCGKTTFLRRLLPQHLRQYYLDHLNLSNKFDKEMALTNNLLVNLDELEAIRPSQQSNLKQTLSKSKVNGRPIFGRVQEDRLRYASFVATTNNPHPLTDATGSRRYICLTIPEGMFIDNSGDIDYDQLYAQVMYELRELKSPYWFNNDEVARIQELNHEYMEQKDIAEMVAICFRKPAEGETGKAMNCGQILKLIQDEYPSLQMTHSNKIHVGKALKELGFDSTERSHVPYYKVIPLKSA
jgi:predicted P-loop ATPase